MKTSTPSLLAAMALSAAVATTKSNAFVINTSQCCAKIMFPKSTTTATRSRQQQPSNTNRFMSESGESSGSVFVADVEGDEVEDKTFDAVEMMGKGAAKVKRGKRKGGESAASTTPSKAFATLAPEETFYEGPPAITETIAPTISILTVVGIVPAAAAWARQAWVRYTITNRRIRVTSGIGGKDMAEIVYPDVVEIRTVKRLFGDGDMVFFLRDGAKFEMRNVPNFDETIQFVLGNVNKDVADMYKRERGVVAQ